jgi:MFS family permease
VITLATYGVGMLIGFWIAGIVADKYAISNDVHNWKNIWMIPAIIAFVILILFAAFFKQPTKRNITEPEAEISLAQTPSV